MEALSQECSMRHAKLATAIIGLVLSISLVASFAIANAAASQAREIMVVAAAQASSVSTETSGHIEKLRSLAAAQMAEIESLKATLVAVDKRTARIEDKLDRQGDRP